MTKIRIPKQIITDEMHINMNILAVTNPAIRNILEQAKVIYALAGSPKFYDEDDWTFGDEMISDVNENESPF